MDYKFMGKTGVKVSPLCFGTMTFGNEADPETSQQVFDRCVEAGINFFDCANTYAGGRSEEYLGKFIAGKRHDFVITSKVYFPTSPMPNDRGTSRKNIMHSIEQSLRRLGTDYLDVYFLHKFDIATPLDETLRAMDDLVHQGKVLYIGASNFAAWQVEKALGISALGGLAPISILQPMYNLIKRQAEVEILPMAQAETLAVISYSPLGGGFLTGKYKRGSELPAGRVKENPVYTNRYSDEAYLEIAEGLGVLAQELGVPMPALAVAWVAAHPGITAPIIGARNLDQLNPVLKSMEIEMTPELYQRIAALSPTPPLATDRLEEQLKPEFARR